MPEAGQRGSRVVVRLSENKHPGSVDESHVAGVPFVAAGGRPATSGACSLLSSAACQYEAGWALKEALVLLCPRAEV